MATQGRKAYTHNTATSPVPSGTHLIENARLSAAHMAEYYHTQVAQQPQQPTNGHVSPTDSGEQYYRRRVGSVGLGNDPRTRQLSAKQQHIGALPGGVAHVAGDLHNEGYNTGGLPRSHTQNDMMDDMPSGQFRATPVNVEYAEDQYPDRGEYERPTEAKAVTHESRSSTATKVSLKNREQASKYWHEDMPEDHRRARSGAPPHRRHNTSPEHHYFMPALEHVKSGDRKPVALTTDNLKYFERTDDRAKHMRRSNSNSTLNEVIMYNDRTRGGLEEAHRSYGSTSSIDVRSMGGESFFQMLQDFSAETDQRSPAPPQFNKLLQGKVPLTKKVSVELKAKDTVDAPTQEEAQPTKRSSTITNPDSDDGFESPRLRRKNLSKREKKARSKSNPASETSFLRRLRNSTKGESGRSRSLNMDDATLALRMEERTRKRAFQHFDVQSMLFDPEDVIKNKDSLRRKTNMATGASAASRPSANTPEVSCLPVSRFLNNELRCNTIVNAN